MTNMDSGHTGGSGRFGSSDENARIMAWLLAQASKPR
jgi:protease II